MDDTAASQDRSYVQILPQGKPTRVIEPKMGLKQEGKTEWYAFVFQHGISVLSFFIRALDLAERLLMYTPRREEIMLEPYKCRTQGRPHRPDKLCFPSVPPIPSAAHPLNMPHFQDKLLLLAKIHLSDKLHSRRKHRHHGHPPPERAAKEC